MYSPTQLEVIQLFGKKDLSEGCLIQQGEYIMKIWCIYEGIYNMKEIKSANCMQKNESELGEILGHIPHLEDVFRVAEEKLLKCSIQSEGTNNTIHIYSMNHTKDGKDYYITCNASLPLIDQQESVLIELLTIFK